MRLPQSSIRPLSVHPVHFLTVGMALLLLALAPVGASATVAQLTSSPSSLRFGAIDVGQSETLLMALTNNGQTSVTLTEITVNNSEFVTSTLSLPLVLQAGESVDLTVGFTPTAAEWTGGTIKVSSNASNSTLSIDLGGSGVRSESVTASPSLLSFGDVAIGANSSLPLVLTNAKSRNVTLSGVQTTNGEFSVNGPAFPLTLGAGQSVAVTVTFAPQSAGGAGGSVFVYGPALSIPLTGTGTGTTAGQLIIAPSPLSFGDVAVGSTQTQSLTLSASGATVIVSSASSNNSQFILDGASFPLTIASGQSLSFNVAFTPQSSGIESGSLSFVSNASNSNAIESLTGTGTATQYSVNLNWNSTQDVVGYNVYRSSSANGTYSKLNSTLQANTAYTDNSVASGKTYFYAATSVNSAGQESARSTPPVEAVIP
jgi:hypothetical protein